MVSKEVTVSNKLGIHARPAAQFVKTASQFEAEIRVEKDGEEINGKSIMGLMMLAAGHGSVLKLIAEGPDADEALQSLEDLVVRNFGEA
ncbi:MAG: phosphocarrier protein HPr [Roseibacillus sp.]|nr:phosphocarrier protein HPr [Roseibacillus sp.]HAO97037.1 HPr family phosphocarrier protein [Verrucomicrobiales bacterium]|tara:strand:+ start:883 stop:1149 length:267 start_codon:yes stop_codon:yes gene_type:complete